MLREKGYYDEYFIDPKDGKVTIFNIGKDVKATRKGIVNPEKEYLEKLKLYQKMAKAQEAEDAKSGMDKYSKNGAHKAYAQH